MRTDITVAMRNAMKAEPAPEPETAAPSPTAEPALAGRTWRGRLFGRVADYARRYLTASIEHRLTLMFDVFARIEDHQRATTARLDHLAGVVLRLSDRLATVDQAVASLGALERAVGQFGPRFDELEIKARPMIAFDEASYAVRMREGYVFVPRDQPVFAVMVANATSGGLEPGVRRVLQSLITPGMAVADVGANIGLHTLTSAVAAGPKGRVYAFEPEAGPRAQLQKMLHFNGLSWVEVFDVALGEKAQRQIFHISPIIGHSSLYALPAEEAAEARSVEVEVRRLDDVVAPGAPLDVVKMDVEGAELDVLAGMGRLLAENRDIALVAEFGPSHLRRIGAQPTDWFNAFAAQGFSAFEIVEPTGFCRPATAAGLADVDSANLVFVRPGGAAERRLPR